SKLVNTPINCNVESFHPFYDDLENDKWLKVRIVTFNPMVLSYFVDAPTSWSQNLQERVKHHFNSFGLDNLYSTHAIEDFENHKKLLEKVFQNGGSHILKDHLKDMYLSRLEY
ncbi:hypothetical protein, partial [Leptospira bourretii]|uniref:hypothetical protein n=1 Tax=Leptospira bourretii TaxID=2484962 RepID=UPI001AEF80BC